MTGIERLRMMAKTDMANGYASESRILSNIADKIEREHRSDLARYHVPWSKVQNVMLDMELHVLGVEGMDDSPVARWSRELRGALGGEERDPSKNVSMSAYDLLPQEDREAIAWVREHGGIGAVQTMVDTLKDTLNWMRERAGVGKDELVDYDELPDALDRRLMPEGMEEIIARYPRYEDGMPALPGMEAVANSGSKSGEAFTIRKAWLENCSWHLSDHVADGHYWHWKHKDSVVKRPAPVLAADGRPLREGETVWYVPTPDEAKECKVEELPEREKGERAVCLRALDGTVISCPTRYVTHERPDSYDTLWEDIEACAVGYEGFMRRVKALAGGA